MNNAKKYRKNSRMEKTGDLFKKIRDTKGTFHTRMGTVKNRNGKDLTEAEEMRIHRNYTKNVLMTWITTVEARHPGV